MKVLIVAGVDTKLDALTKLLKESKVAAITVVDQEGNPYMCPTIKPLVINKKDLHPNDQILGAAIRKLML